MKKIILFCLMAFSISLANNSVYSGYGFGFPINSVSVRSMGLGQSGIAAHDSIALNSQNPSQWYGFYTTSLEGRFISSLVNNENETGLIGSNNITGFTVKVPMGEYAGFALGLLPVTRVNFKTEYSNTLISDYDTLNSVGEYDVTGGITELFAGFGYQATRNLSLGFKSRFLFGLYDKMIQIDISDDESYNIIYEDRYELKGVRFGLGATWHDNQDDFTASAYFEQGFGLNYSINSNYYYTPNNYYYVPDSAIAEGEMTYPYQFSLGLSKKIGSAFRVFGQFDFQHVNSGDYSEITLYQIVNGSDGYKISCGIEKTPESFFGNYARHFTYRGGFYYQKYPFETSLTETGLTLGMGIPFNKYLSRADIALTLAKRKSSFNFGDEEVISFNLSVTTGGLWFKAMRRY